MPGHKLRDFIPGIRVEYVDGSYGASEGNPLKGSEYYCTGKVTDTDGSLVYVLWDNGHSNDYRPETLNIIDCSDPNILFQQNKRKKRRI